MCLTLRFLCGTIIILFDFFLPARRIRRKEGTALGVSNQQLSYSNVVVMVPGALKGHVPTFPDEYFSCRRFPIFVFHIQRNPNTRVKIAFSETINKRKKKEEKLLQI